MQKFIFHNFWQFENDQKFNKHFNLIWTPKFGRKKTDKTQMMILKKSLKSLNLSFRRYAICAAKCTTAPDKDNVRHTILRGHHHAHAVH